MDHRLGAQPSGERPSGKGVVTPTSTLVDLKVRCDRCNAACAVRVILPSGLNCLLPPPRQQAQGRADQDGCPHRG